MPKPDVDKRYCWPDRLTPCDASAEPTRPGAASTPHSVCWPKRENTAMPHMSKNTTVETLLRERGDHLADVGQPRRAVEIYEELLDRLEASEG